MVEATRARMRRPPNYWWDFNHYSDGSMTIVLETDDPRCIGGVIEETPPLPQGDCTTIINAVESKLKDFRSGRRTLESQEARS